MSIKNVSGWVAAVIATLSALALVFAIVIIALSTTSNDYSFRIQRDNMELMYEGARADLVQSIDSVIRVAAPTTCMNGLAVLRECEKYNIDIFFVLAQGHLESHFGTKGMALKTNSVFNVYAYDGYSYEKINSKGKYSHPDLSIEPYLKLLSQLYLVNGKTETDLMHNYVDVNGQRYASSKDYENNLTEKYHKYVSDENLMNNYKKYTKYKILSGK
jgi:hypothetical protein